METVLLGNTITFESEFLDSPGGALVDPDSVSVQIESNGVAVAGPFTPTRQDTGLYTYAWLVPSSTTVGTYYARWTAVIAGNVTLGYDAFTVATTTVTGDIQPQDVADLTGTTVTAAQVNTALAIIELFASIDLSDFTRFGARDRRWLRDAICWQAAWMTAQPDFATRSDFTNMSQDGLSFTTRDMTTVMLGPLARKALSRVSWLRARITKSPHSKGLGQAWLPAGAPVIDTDEDNWQAM